MARWGKMLAPGLQSPGALFFLRQAISTRYCDMPTKIDEGITTVADCKGILKVGNGNWQLTAKLAEAAVVGLTIVLFSKSPVALADSAASGPTNIQTPIIQTPMGRAPLTFADIVDRVKGSVVSVYITGKGDSDAETSNAPDSFPDLPPDHPLNQFFKKFKKGQEGNQPSPDLKAQGSGFVISDDGYVVTNNHVVEGATKIEVSFDENERITADVVGTDPRTDLALLKVKTSKKLAPVAFSHAPVRVGDWVLTIGNPFGLGGTVTAGIVSAQARDIGSGPYDYLQIDASVNKGNSGGPTFNINGEVVGVTSAIFSPTGGSVGIAFAIPGQLVERVVADLKAKGSVSRGWLGVHIQNISDEIAGSIGLQEVHGALVTKITEQGPAANTALKVGDAILAVDGDKIENSRDLARKIADFAPGVDVRLTVFRDGKEHDVTIKLGQFPDDKQLAKLEDNKTSQAPETLDVGELGLSLAPASVLGDSQAAGVLITKVASGSEASDKGLQAGDIILEVAGSAVAAPSDIAKSISEAKKAGRKAILLRIKSSDGEKFIPLKLASG
jgi:serine protease Do